VAYVPCFSVAITWEDYAIIGAFSLPKYEAVHNCIRWKNSNFILFFLMGNDNVHILVCSNYIGLDIRFRHTFSLSGGHLFLIEVGVRLYFDNKIYIFKHNTNYKQSGRSYQRLYMQISCHLLL
jgi:hypothetical protein